MDFLSPQDQNAAPQGPTVLDQFLQNPKLQAAALQFGINAAQPLAWGQTPFAGLLSAVGGGAEAAQRQEAEDIKQQEANSKEDLRTAQAGAAEARANTAGARSDTAAQRLAFMQTDAERKRAIADQALQLHYHQLYNKMVKDIENENSVLPTSKKKPVPTPEQFFNSIGVGHIMTAGSVPEGEVTGSGVPVATPGDASRAPGKYSTPRGIGYWDGKAWHF